MSTRKQSEQPEKSDHKQDAASQENQQPAASQAEQRQKKLVLPDPQAQAEDRQPASHDPTVPATRRADDVGAAISSAAAPTVSVAGQDAKRTTLSRVPAT